MVLIKTQSGRYLNRDHLVALSVEDAKIEREGKILLVYRILADLPGQMLPAILATYPDEREAYEALDRFADTLSKAQDAVLKIEPGV